jgi:hypothetical protein
MTRRRSKVGGRRAGAGRKPLDPDVTRTKVVTTRITPPELAAATEIAERERLTLSNFSRAAIQLAIARGSTR